RGGGRSRGRGPRCRRSRAPRPVHSRSRDRGGLLPRRSGLGPRGRPDRGAARGGRSRCPGEDRAMNLYVGTSGFAYKEWKGFFYPEDLAANQMLRFYGERLRTVEINNTFYRMPKTSVVEAWAAEVPESFRFVLKASQRITHMKRLKDAAEPLAYFLEVAGVLKERLGPLLFQLPPNFKKDAPRLQAFL